LLSVDQEIDLPNFPTKKPTKPNKGDAGVSVPIKDIIKDRYNSLTSDSASGGVFVLGKSNQILGTVKNALIIGDGNVVQKDGIYTPSVTLKGTELVAPTATFKALVSQVGTSNPTMDIAVDQFGLTITRSGIGTYRITSSGLFLGKVICVGQWSKQTNAHLSIGKISDSIVEIVTVRPNNHEEDELLDNTTIIIESWQTR
jgi:hypothetical protein